MLDREKVIGDIERCVYRLPDGCRDCSHYGHDKEDLVGCMDELLSDALELLKEQEEEIENLKQTAQSMMEGICLLKEQEAVKPTWGRGKPYCGACGSKIRGGKFCSECGKPILWEGSVKWDD